jgi:hypothetical protein
MANQQNNPNPAKPEKAPQQDQQPQKQPQPDGGASKQPQQNQQQDPPHNPADPSKGQPQHVQQAQQKGKDDAFASKSRGAEDESRGKEGGVSPGAQDMQRDKFSGEKMPRH